VNRVSEQWRARKAERWRKAGVPPPFALLRVCPERSEWGRLCGSSSSAGSCRVANWIIRILLGPAAQGASRLKSRKAELRALRYISS
jgi:hypothetical protein